MMLQLTTFPSSGTPAASQFPSRLQQLVSALKPLRSQLAVPHLGKFQSPSAGDFYIAFIPLDWHPPIHERSSELHKPKFRSNETTIANFFPIYAAGAVAWAPGVIKGVLNPCPALHVLFPFLFLLGSCWLQHSEGNCWCLIWLSSNTHWHSQISAATTDSG